MTLQTKKILISLLLCLVLALTVALGVFCFIPNFEVNMVGDYYQSAYAALQKSAAFTDTVKATYSIKLDDDAEGENVVNAIKTRLSKTYGYYGSKADYDKASGIVTVEIPVSDNTNTRVKPTAQTILNNVIVNGKVEILNVDYSSSPSYSEDSVVLTQEHFRHASVRSYLNQNVTLYICRVRLTKEGAKLAEALAESTPYTVAIDGSVETWVYWTGSELQITYAYTDEATSEEHARAMNAYISSGALNATLTQEGSTTTAENNLGWIYLAIMGAVVLASFIFFAVRYKALGLIPMVTQALAVFVFMFFGVLVHLEIFNIAMGIGVVLSYVFMTVFSALGFEKVRKLMVDGGKNYSVARHQALAFSRDNRKDIFISLIAHGALLVLGIILWVIPTLVTAPLGNAFVYGAVLSLIVTFGLNRLFALMVSPFFEVKKSKAKSRS